MTSQTSAMTAIMETSNSKVNEIKNMFASIQAALHDGPSIASPPRKQRQRNETMVTNTNADNTDPLSPEAAGTPK